MDLAALQILDVVVVERRCLEVRPCWRPLEGPPSLADNPRITVRGVGAADVAGVGRTGMDVDSSVTAIQTNDGVRFLSCMPPVLASCPPL